MHQKISNLPQSLIFWASLPILMLLLMLMSLLAYLVFRCICKLRAEEEVEEGEVHEPSFQSIQNCLSCLRWTSTSLAIIAWLASFLPIPTLFKVVKHSVMLIKYILRPLFKVGLLQLVSMATD